METRVVIADDHPVVLAGVRAVLQKHRRYQVVGEARDPDTLASVLEHTPTDILLTDFSMPGGTLPDGQVMLSTLRRHYPHLPIILMTMFTREASLRVALRSGIRGIVDKTAPLSNVATAVARVSAGGVHIDERMRGLLDADGDSPVFAMLSACEYEVLRLYVSGPSITEIAGRLNRTVSTISRQRMSAMRKLGVRNAAELFAFTFEHGLGAPPGLVKRSQR